MLAGFRSRCSTPRSCAAASPAQSCARSPPPCLPAAGRCGAARREILAVDVLHRQEQLAVDFADVVDAADVRMRDLPRGPHLVVELRQPRRIARRASPAGTSARPAGPAAGRRRDRPRPCRRVRAGRRCGSGRRGSCPGAKRPWSIDPDEVSQPPVVGAGPPGDSRVSSAPPGRNTVGSAPLPVTSWPVRRRSGPLRSPNRHCHGTWKYRILGSDTRKVNPRCLRQDHCVSEAPAALEAVWR